MDSYVQRIYAALDCVSTNNGRLNHDRMKSTVLQCIASMFSLQQQRLKRPPSGGLLFETAQSETDVMYDELFWRILEEISCAAITQLSSERSQNRQGSVDDLDMVSRLLEDFMRKSKTSSVSGPEWLPLHFVPLITEKEQRREHLPLSILLLRNLTDNNTNYSTTYSTDENVPNAGLNPSTDGSIGFRMPLTAEKTASSPDSPPYSSNGVSLIDRDNERDSDRKTSYMKNLTYRNSYPVNLRRHEPHIYNGFDQDSTNSNTFDQSDDDHSMLTGPRRPKGKNRKTHDTESPPRKPTETTSIYDSSLHRRPTRTTAGTATGNDKGRHDSDSPPRTLTESLHRKPSLDYEGTVSDKTDLSVKSPLSSKSAHNYLQDYLSVNVSSSSVKPLLSVSAAAAAAGASASSSSLSQSYFSRNIIREEQRVDNFYKPPTVDIRGKDIQGRVAIGSRSRKEDYERLQQLTDLSAKTRISVASRNISKASEDSIAGSGLYRARSDELVIAAQEMRMSARDETKTRGSSLNNEGGRPPPITAWLSSDHLQSDQHESDHHQPDNHQSDRYHQQSDHTQNVDSSKLNNSHRMQDDDPSMSMTPAGYIHDQSLPHGNSNIHDHSMPHSNTRENSRGRSSSPVHHLLYSHQANFSRFNKNQIKEKDHTDYKDPLMTTGTSGSSQHRVFDSASNSRPQVQLPRRNSFSHSVEGVGSDGVCVEANAKNLASFGSTKNSAGFGSNSNSGRSSSKINKLLNILDPRDDKEIKENSRMSIKTKDWIRKQQALEARLTQKASNSLLSQATSSSSSSSKAPSRATIKQSSSTSNSNINSNSNNNTNTNSNNNGNSSNNSNNSTNSNNNIKDPHLSNALLSIKKHPAMYNVSMFLSNLPEYGKFVILGDMSISMATNNRIDCQERCIAELMNVLVNKRCRIGVGMCNNQVRWLTLKYALSNMPTIGYGDWLHNMADVLQVLRVLKNEVPQGGNDMSACIEESIKAYPDATDICIISDGDTRPFIPTFPAEQQLYATARASLQVAAVGNRQGTEGVRDTKELLQTNWQAFRSRYPDKTFHFIAIGNRANKQDLYQMSIDGGGLFCAWEL